ncbi:MAG: hypothetical protein VSS52_002875 [Thiotrichaceae bacterium]|nr:hypothetical protein [Thiotrichaceae bacterium]
MRIAVASRDGKTIKGHMGKYPHWIIFEVSISEQNPEPLVQELERITLEKQFTFHHYKDEQPHPLQSCVAVIGAGSGEGFKKKMEQRGIEAVIVTTELNPEQAVLDYARKTAISL